MAFAKDRDLAVVEPTVFRDLAWMGQVVTRGECMLFDRSLEAVGAITPDFVDSGVGDGMAVVVGGSVGAVYEVVGVSGGNLMNVSRLRRLGEGPELPLPTTETAVPFTVVTFAPQIEWVHGQLLEMLGLRRDTAIDATRLPESRVKNADELLRLEAYGALQLIFAAAAGLSASAPQLLARASQWRRAFQDERQRVAARIDTDGDGNADVIRRFNVGQFVR